jgi:hypothetical protein
MTGTDGDHSKSETIVHGNSDTVLIVHDLHGNLIKVDPHDRARTWARILGSLHPSLKSHLVEHELLPMPKGWVEEQAYLEWLRSDLNRLNLGDLNYVPLAALPSGEQTGDNSYTADAGGDLRAPVRRIRSQLRLLQGRALGGDEATAEIAAAGRPSRTIRDAAKWLAKTEDPVIILGDPGSGKSTTLREVGIALAERGRRRVAPLIPVYVSLASYREVNRTGEPAEVMDLLCSAIPPSHAEIRKNLPNFIRQRRLVLLFDAMDEMERSAYSQRVEKLSEFASSYTRQIRSVFACRTNDFIASFKHRQLVILPFSYRQIVTYIKLNFPSPLIIDGVNYPPAQTARLLLSSSEFNDVITNPLTLYLLREYLTDRQAWPRNRNELFEAYIYKVLLRGIQGVEVGARIAPDAAKEALAQVAFAIATVGGGSYIDVRQLNDILGDKFAEVVLRIGFGSGILSIDPYKKVNFESERRMGVLMPDESVGFFHHRIQEYLCAYHLSNADDRSVLDWDQLLDNPRWQETVLHLALMPKSGSAPWAVLRNSLEEVLEVYGQIAAQKEALKDEEKTVRKQREAIKPDSVSHSQMGSIEHYSPEKTQQRRELQERADGLMTQRLELKPEPGWERQLADRTLLSARAFAIKADLMDRDDDLLRNAVGTIAAHGRPTSQVKMLLAWKDASALIAAEAVEVPRRSPVAWVRNQAILAFARLAGTRKHPDASLRDELEFDFATGHIQSRAAVYFKAADGRPARIALLLWATLTYFLSRIALFGAALAVLFLTVNGLPDWHGLFSTIGRAGSAGAIAFLLLASLVLLLPVGLPRLLDSFAWATGAGCTALVVAALAVDGHYSLAGFGFGEQGWHDSFWENVSRGVLLLAAWPLLAIALARVGSFAIGFLLFQLPHLPWQSPKATLQRLLLAFRRMHLGVETVIVWAAAGTLLFTGATAGVMLLMPYWPATATMFFKFLGYILFGLFFIFTCTIAVVMVFFMIGEYTDKRTRIKLILGVIVAVPIIIFITKISAAIYSWYPQTFNYIGKGLIALMLLIVAVLVVLFGAWLFWELAGDASKRLRRWAGLLYWFVPSMLGYRRFVGPLPTNALDWVALFSTGNPYLQRIMLENVSYRRLGLKDERTLLALLERCEVMVRREPALSAFWRKRYDVEATVSHSEVAYLQNGEGR